MLVYWFSYTFKHSHSCYNHCVKLLIYRKQYRVTQMLSELSIRSLNSTILLTIGGHKPPGHNPLGQGRTKLPGYNPL